MHPAVNQHVSADIEGDVDSHKSTQICAEGWATAANYSTAKIVYYQVHHTTTTAKILQSQLKID